MRYPAATVLVVWGLAAFAPALRAQQAGITNSPHNLSAGGPGPVRAVAEQEVCIFCHTPHNASPVQPLWNRELPASAYTVYSSSSLKAQPGQPTGSSKLCLSCHDGTIAVGSVLSRNQPIAMAGGITTLPPGKGNLGTDLSDDHPISFRYDANLSSLNPKVKPPDLLPAEIRLDRNLELQCTSCHNPHNNINGAFLVMPNTNSQLCNACHQPGQTTVASHTSCESCHTMHSAPSGALLLKATNPSDTCLTCHGGQGTGEQGANIAADMQKISRHYTPESGAVKARPPVGPVQTAQSVLPGQVTCGDCHEPHTIKSGTASAPLVSPKMGDVSGVNASGAQVPLAQYQFEVCFKCHNDTAVTQPKIGRLIVQNNTRLEFAPNAVSFHPVEAAGRSNDVPSLVPGLTTASLIYCTDCHASDTGAAAGGGGANGPHGSNVPPLLVARYETIDGTPESASAYALCYRCHNRNSFVSEGNDQPFPLHRKHVVDQQTPCSVCHDGHGISSAQGNARNNAHLINFDTSVVQPFNGKIEYRSNGPGSRSGNCTLMCHNFAHDALPYPVLEPVNGGDVPPAGPSPLLRRRPAATVKPSVPSLRPRAR